MKDYQIYKPIPALLDWKPANSIDVKANKNYLLLLTGDNELLYGYYKDGSFYEHGKRYRRRLLSIKGFKLREKLNGLVLMFAEIYNIPVVKVVKMQH